MVKAFARLNNLCESIIYNKGSYNKKSWLKSINYVNGLSMNE